MPKYREHATGAKRTVAGVVFYSWAVGIGRYEWRTEDGRACVWSNGVHLSTYSATVDGRKLPTRFRSQETAAKAAITALTTAKQSKADK